MRLGRQNYHPRRFVRNFFICILKIIKYIFKNANFDIMKRLSCVYSDITYLRHIQMIKVAFSINQEISFSESESIIES